MPRTPSDATRRGTVPPDSSRRERRVPLDHPELVQNSLSQAPRLSPGKSARTRTRGSRAGRRRRRRRGGSESTRGDGRRVVLGRGTGPRAYRSHRGGETGRGTTGRVFAGSLRIIGFASSSASSSRASSPRATRLHASRRRVCRALLGRVLAGAAGGRSIPSRGGRPRAASREGVVSEPGDVRGARTRATGRGGARRQGTGTRTRTRARAGGWPAAGRVQRRVRWGARRREGAVRSASGAGARRWSAIVSSKEAPTLHRASATALSLARSRSSARARSVRGGLSRERSIRRGRRGRREPARVGTMATARAWVATCRSTLAEQRSRVRELKLGRAADAAVGLVQRGGPPDAADVRAGTDVSVPRFNVRADQRTA